MAEPSGRPSIYDAAGGAPAFLALANAHYERCLADPVLSHPFSHGGHPQHIERLGAYWAEVMGGPPVFSSECGGHSGMLGIHAGMAAEPELADRFVACFVGAMDDAGLPDDAELRTALRSYMEWAIADLMAYSPVDSSVPAGLDMPRWSWDGLAEVRH